MELQRTRGEGVVRQMSPEIAEVSALVRNELVRLARFEDALAEAEAEAAPYWASCPDSVQAHRMAAVALRARAEAVTGPYCDARPLQADLQRSLDTSLSG
jgi:hypothetical protein